MNTLWYKSLSKTPVSKTIIDTWHSMDNLSQKRKYRKWLRKGPLEKDLTFFSTEWWLQSTLLITISIHNAIKWHHFNNNATFKKLQDI